MTAVAIDRPHLVAAPEPLAGAEIEVALNTSDQPTPVSAPTAPRHRAPGRGRLIAASVILGAPSVAAIWGSATQLTAIAREDAVTSPWTLPFCLDVLALGMVLVAVLVPGGGFVRRLTPWACYLFSAVLQVSAAWAGGPRAWGTHAAALVAAAIGSHVILDLWAHAVEVAEKHERALAQAIADAEATHERTLAEVRAQLEEAAAGEARSVQAQHDRALASMHAEVAALRTAAEDATAAADRRASAAEGSATVAVDGARAAEQARQQLALEVDGLRRQIKGLDDQLERSRYHAAGLADERSSLLRERQALQEQLTAAKARPTPTQRSTSKPTSKPAADPDPGVLAKVDAALAEMGVTAHDAKRDDVLEHLRPGAPHATKVGAALNYRRDNP